MDSEAKKWRDALINEIASMYACEGSPHPYSLTLQGTIEPLSKYETALVIEEAEKKCTTDKI